MGGIHYLNSGDWVESLTAIIEHHDGRMELVRHHEFIVSHGQGDQLETELESNQESFCGTFAGLAV